MNGRFEAGKGWCRVVGTEQGIVDGRKQEMKNRDRYFRKINLNSYLQIYHSFLSNQLIISTENVVRTLRVVRSAVCPSQT